jgi:hypothetical protein
MRERPWRAWQSYWRHAQWCCATHAASSVHAFSGGGAAAEEEGIARTCASSRLRGFETCGDSMICLRFLMLEVELAHDHDSIGCMKACVRLVQ